MPRFTNPFKNNAPKDDFDATYYGEDTADIQDDAIYSAPKADANVDHVNPTPASAPKRTGYMSASSSAVTMKLMKPSSYQEATTIADQLMNNCAVVMNLENTNKETASNLIYFLSGVIYAINGHMKPVSEDTYMLAPSNMEIAEESTSAASSTEGLDAYGY